MRWVIEHSMARAWDVGKDKSVGERHVYHTESRAAEGASWQAQLACEAALMCLRPRLLHGTCSGRLRTTLSAICQIQRHDPPSPSLQSGAFVRPHTWSKPQE